MENNVCNQKELCQKMRNASLQVAVDRLKVRRKQLDSRSIRNNLYSIYDLLSTYDCMTATYLGRRVLEVRCHINNLFSTLSTSEKDEVDMLIAELETFIKEA